MSDLQGKSQKAICLGNTRSSVLDVKPGVLYGGRADSSGSAAGGTVISCVPYFLRWVFCL